MSSPKAKPSVIDLNALVRKQKELYAARAAASPQKAPSKQPVLLEAIKALKALKVVDTFVALGDSRVDEAVKTLIAADGPEAKEGLLVKTLTAMGNSCTRSAWDFFAAAGESQTAEAVKALVAPEDSKADQAVEALIAMSAEDLEAVEAAIAPSLRPSKVVKVVKAGLGAEDSEAAKATEVSSKVEQAVDDFRAVTDRKAAHALEVLMGSGPGAMRALDSLRHARKYNPDALKALEAISAVKDPRAREAMRNLWLRMTGGSKTMKALKAVRALKVVAEDDLKAAEALIMTEVPKAVQAAKAGRSPSHDLFLLLHLVLLSGSYYVDAVLKEHINEELLKENDSEGHAADAVLKLLQELEDMVQGKQQWAREEQKYVQVFRWKVAFAAYILRTLDFRAAISGPADLTESEAKELFQTLMAEREQLENVIIADPYVKFERVGKEEELFSEASTALFKKISFLDGTDLQRCKEASSRIERIKRLEKVWLKSMGFEVQMDFTSTKSKDGRIRCDVEFLKYEQIRLGEQRELR